MTAHDDARYAEVLSFPSRRELVRRLPPLVLGVVIVGLAISVSVRARLGLAPWDVFHQGIAHSLHQSLGTVVILVGLVVLLGWIPLRQRLGIGTIINTVGIGLTANLGLHVVPVQDAMAARIAFLFLALVMFGVGGGLYIGAGLGPGPRDGLMTAIAARGYRIWAVRTVMECTVLAVGFALGGHVGIGTVLLALAIGPATHLGLRRFHLPTTSSPEVLGE